jgi:pimeloyl-ACP methyl ester carboxylesterase
MGPRFLEVNGARIALWERPGIEPAIFLAHATGCHGRCWDAVTDHIGAQRCIAVDLRGHGHSSKPEPPIAWRQFGLDVAEIVRQLGLKGAIAAGHSMGGYSIALAAALIPEAFSRLILVDPVIMVEEAYAGPIIAPHFARRRRNRWASWEEMFETFRNKAPFQTWDEQVLRDYCEYGLLPAPDGDGWVLACPPEIEGSIYEQSCAREANIYPEIAKVKAPATIIRSPAPFVLKPVMEMSDSPAAPDLASRFANGQDMLVEHSHFIPMEAPELVADQILRALTPVGTA